MKTIYLAHEYGGDPKNREAAKRWARWALDRGVAVVADWLWITEVWDESRRDQGLAIDFELIERVDEVWLVGPRISDGMAQEAKHAKFHGKAVFDFTGLVLP